MRWSAVPGPAIKKGTRGNTGNTSGGTPASGARVCPYGTTGWHAVLLSGGAGRARRIAIRTPCLQIGHAVLAWSGARPWAAGRVLAGRPVRAARQGLGSGC